MDSAQGISAENRAVFDKIADLVTSVDF